MRPAQKEKWIVNVYKKVKRALVNSSRRNIFLLIRFRISLKKNVGTQSLTSFLRLISIKTLAEVLDLAGSSEICICCSAHLG